MHSGGTAIFHMRIDQFWSRVDKSGGPDACWPWVKAKPGKYGSVTINGKPKVASRVAYELARGPLAPGLLACHTCDNPPCCNPAHLFAGTYYDNTMDAIRKGRFHGNNTPRGHHQHWRIDESKVKARAAELGMPFDELTINLKLSGSRLRRLFNGGGFFGRTLDKFCDVLECSPIAFMVYLDDQPAPAGQPCEA
jgi:DNA-binding Xre family transcriptional regulator